VVEHRDRLARSGDQFVEVAVSVCGRRLLVVNGGEVDEDLVGNVAEFLTSSCVRRYGRRAAANRVARVVGVVTARDPS